MTPYVVHTDSALPFAAEITSKLGKCRLSLHNRPGDVGCHSFWPAPGSEDTELGVFMGPEVSHGATKVYAGIQT
jgi:hypothetical protein